MIGSNGMSTLVYTIVPLLPYITPLPLPLLVSPELPRVVCCLCAFLYSSLIHCHLSAPVSSPVEVPAHSSIAVPTPMNLVKYLDDPSYEHEDFNNSSVGTLRARVRPQPPLQE